jgi:hypothetical protein
LAWVARNEECLETSTLPPTIHFNNYAIFIVVSTVRLLYSFASPSFAEVHVYSTPQFPRTRRDPNVAINSAIAAPFIHAVRRLTSPYTARQSPGS